MHGTERRSAKYYRQSFAVSAAHSEPEFAARYLRNYTYTRNVKTNSNIKYTQLRMQNFWYLVIKRCTNVKTFISSTLYYAKHIASYLYNFMLL